MIFFGSHERQAYKKNLPSHFNINVFNKTYNKFLNVMLLFIRYYLIIYIKKPHANFFVAQTLII